MHQSRIGAEHSLTLILNNWQSASDEAKSEIFRQIQPELKRLAASLIARARERGLQPTQIVDDLYLRLLNQRKREWTSRKHFYATAAQVMRYIFLDYIRSDNAQKRGSGGTLLSLQEILGTAGEPADPSGEAALWIKKEEILALHQGLRMLEEISPRRAKIIELSYFGGFTMEEIADTLVPQVSPITVKREYARAHAFLRGILMTSQEPEANA
jgi:RNA polymerase sigma factor (TIGR02999 family)